MINKYHSVIEFGRPVYVIIKYYSVIEFGRPAGVIINYYNVINLKVIIKNHKSNIDAPIPTIPIGLIYNIDLLGFTGGGDYNLSHYKNPYASCKVKRAANFKKCQASCNLLSFKKNVKPYTSCKFPIFRKETVKPAHTLSFY